jgi:hypothetical protein
MTPRAFAEKWQRIEAKERTIAQTHFNELCDLLGVPKPLDVDAKGDFYTSEKPVEKVTGGPPTLASTRNLRQGSVRGVWLGVSAF